MEHKESNVLVYCSSDYARFRMIEGNRELNEAKIRRIMKEINKGNDVLPYYPCLVKERNERLDILDGQNRFYISKKLKRPVYYILAKEDKTMSDIAKVNSNVEKWNAESYIYCYMTAGNKNYDLLKRFMETYGLVVSVSCRMLHSGNPGTEGFAANLSESFKSGTFEVKEWDAAVELAEECKKFSSFQRWRERAFVIAVHRIKQARAVTIDELVSAYKKRPEMLTRQASFKEYIVNMEQIINVGKQKRIVIA